MSIYLSKSSEAEEFFKVQGLKLVFATKSPDELDKGVEKLIKAMLAQKVPSFRRYGVLQFIEGVARGTAFLLGEEAAGKFKVPSPKAAKKSEDIPRSIKKLQPGASWHRHPNGGGWVSSTAYVEASAHVGAKAIVYQNARVTERARIYGTAIVRGDAECYGTCHVHGLAVVEGHARVFDAARVLGKVRVGGAVVIGGNTLVRGEVTLNGTKEFIDERVVRQQDKRGTSVPALARGV